MKTRTRKIIGWTISILMIAFLLFDSIGKITRNAYAVQGTVDLGYPDHSIFLIGMILLLCTILYTIPFTSIFGAILLTAYLGGAVATNFRVEAPLYSHVLFPVYIGILLWVGLMLRHESYMKLLTNKSE
jgi:hypothetical protein